MKKIISIIGARPQFIKHSAVQLALQKKFNAVTLHTGQHYSAEMNDVFFKELQIPKPDFLLHLSEINTHAEQTGKIMMAVEKVLIKEKPTAVLVYGDTNSTLAAVLASSKLQIPIIHIEAGLRAYNNNMPEEINRIIADKFSEVLFCSSTNGINNLAKEGITHQHIYNCGDVMLDAMTLVQAQLTNPVEQPYIFATLHRPYNVDNKHRLFSLFKALNQLNKKIILSLHPRTIKKMKEFEIDKKEFANIKFIAALGYKDSIRYQKFADCVITDSGGMQKEAYFLKVKCITIRSETEWLETLENKWNQLIFDDLTMLQTMVDEVPGKYTDALYGAGNAATSITTILDSIYN
jgi:UDP-GlcNAc3NAcA epimerase